MGKNKNKFAYTISQPSEGRTSIGCEALTQMDLRGSFAKHFRSCQVMMCIALDLAKVPLGEMVVFVRASAKISKDQVPTLVSMVLGFEMCIVSLPHLFKSEAHL